jgi:hypothetical protein
MEIISTGAGRRVKTFLVTPSTDFGSDHVGSMRSVLSAAGQALNLLVPQLIGTAGVLLEISRGAPSPICMMEDENDQPQNER